MKLQQSSRSGFMILMLIAFTSIILGLSVTFYSYCKRSSDSSAQAVKLVNQRLALAGALQYITSFSALAGGSQAPADLAAGDWAAASKWGGTTLSTSNPFNRSNNSPAPVYSISLCDSNIYRSTKLGWFRVTYPYTTTGQAAIDLKKYFSGVTANGISALPAAIVDSLTATSVIIQNCVLVTTGSGPSKGVFSPSTNWRNENISWYLIELNPNPVPPLVAPTGGSVKRIVSLFPPPQKSTPNQATTYAANPFYW
jgi:hypothetical protein